METEPATEFNVLENLLRDIGALADPAEIHGDLCGLLCLLGDDACPAWVAQVLADVDGTSSAETVSRATEFLENLAQQTFNELEAGELGFTLLLPSDDEALELRAENLGLWCQGFLHGLGVAGPTEHREQTLEEGVTRDIIRDFSEISRAAFSEDETEAEAEAAYIEVVEFVRVSVQLVFEELYLMRSRVDGGQKH